MKGFAIGSIILALAFAATASAQTDLALWTFETSLPTTAGPHFAESGFYSSTSTALGWHADPNSTVTVYSHPAGNGSAASFSSNNWNVGDYYQFQTSTVGYTGIGVAWDQTSSGTGPRDFVLQYSTDGTNFTQFGAQYAVLPNASPPGTWNSTTPHPEYHFTVDLSSITALNNKSTIYIRLVDNSTVSANGGTVAPGGTDRVDNVRIGSAINTPGACCVGESCIVETAANCSTLGGGFQGAGTTCATNPCIGMGACCVGGSCTVKTAATCSTAGGVFKGIGSDCAPNPCLTCITIQDAKVLPANTAVVLCDVVISSDIDLIQGPNGTSMQVQELDSSAGITVFSAIAGDIADILAVANLGDSIRLWGTTATYAGLAELSPPFMVEYIATVGVPAPVVVTAAQLTANPETYESMLIKVECALFRDGGGTFADHTPYIIDDSTGSFVAGITSSELLITGTIPDYPLDIIGILGHNTGGNPWTGYFIQIRRTADLVDNPVCLTTGACCYGETCLEQNQTQCQTNGGTYKGNGTRCTPYNPCVPPWGACCVGGICYADSNPTACDAMNGCYQGDYTLCTPNPCNPPFERGDIALGLSDADRLLTLEQIRDDGTGAGQKVGNLAMFPYIQSVEFDNTVSAHNAHGNLLGLEYGVGVTTPTPGAGQGGNLFNFGTDGSNCGEQLYSFEYGQTYVSNVSGLGVSTDNSYVSIWGNTTGCLYVLGYFKGLTPGTGSGASIGQVWVHTTSGGIVGTTQGSTWYLDGSIRTILLANAPSSTSGTIKLNAVQFVPPPGTPTFSQTTKQTLYFPTAGASFSASDVEYNPAISPFVFVMASFYSSPNTMAFLAVVDPTNAWAPIVFTETGGPYLDLSTVSETSREISLGPDGYLYWSMFSGGTTPHIMRLNVNGNAAAIAALTAADAAAYYTGTVYSSFNGLDVAHGAAPTSGACCLEGVCYMTTSATCTTAGGTFIGVGATCGPPSPCAVCTTIPAAKAGGSDVEVKVCNVVVSSIEDLINSASSKSFYVQELDHSGGITIYGSNADIGAALAGIAVGDRINIQGQTWYSYGVFELNAYEGPLAVTRLGGGSVAPAVIPAAYFTDSNPNAEIWESQLVTVQCLQFNETGTFVGSTTYTATNGTDTVAVRIARNDLALVGQTIPTGWVNITGIFGQYSSTAPYDTGYQLLPRFVTDIVANPSCGGPAICLGDSNCDGTVSWRDIDFFVAAMSGQTAWEAMFVPGPPSCDYLNNDVNEDGIVSWRDIDPFVAQMGTTCPS